MGEPLSHERLKEILDYCPETGVFIWKVAFPGYAAGREAKSKTTQGYVGITYQGKSYLAHRLAWFYVHGTWPESHLDHINQNRADNRLCNLRLASQSENAQNTKKQAKGFYKNQSSFVARIRANGKVLQLGSFKTAQEASLAYQNARQEYHTHHVD